MKQPEKRSPASGKITVNPNAVVTLVMIAIIAALCIVIAVMLGNKQNGKKTVYPAEEDGSAFEEVRPEVTAELPLRPEPEQEGYLPVFYQAGRTDKAVAITVQGMNTETEPDTLLEWCNLYEAKLTFFATGEELLKMSDFWPAARLNGHEIESRGYSGTAFNLMSPEEIEGEVITFEAVAANLLGSGYRTRFLRPNSLKDDERPELHSCLAAKGYYGIVRWSVLQPTKLEQISPGMVIAVDLSSYSTDKLRQMIKVLYDNGYRCVTILELFGYSDPE